MLTDNVSISDRLIDSLIGTVKYLDVISKPPCSAIQKLIILWKIESLWVKKNVYRLLLEQKGFF